MDIISDESLERMKKLYAALGIPFCEDKYRDVASDLLEIAEALLRRMDAADERHGRVIRHLRDQAHE